MRLMIGGFCQGKSSYAAARFPGYVYYDETNYNDIPACISKCIILNHLHLIIRALLQNGNTEPEIQQRFRQMAIASPDILFISDEIGCGIVPLDPEERQWREVTGRVLIALAAEATEVIRMTAGIPQVIKKEA